MGVAERDYIRNRPTQRGGFGGGTGAGPLSAMSMWSVNTWIIAICVVVFVIDPFLGSREVAMHVQPTIAEGHLPSLAGRHSLSMRFEGGNPPTLPFPGATTPDSRRPDQARGIEPDEGRRSPHLLESTRRVAHSPAGASPARRRSRSARQPR